MFCIIDDLMGLAPSSGNELIEMMSEMYINKFDRTNCFSSKVLKFSEDILYSKEIMHEAHKSLSNLFLKFKSWAGGDRLVFADSLYTIIDGSIDKVQYNFLNLLVFGFDVYNVETEVAIAKMKELNYNLDLITEEKCMGKDAWLVGDPSANCFWVDQNNLLFLKIQTRRKENSENIVFTDYELINGMLVATTIYFYDSNGKLTLVLNNIVPK